MNEDSDFLTIGPPRRCKRCVRCDHPVDEDDDGYRLKEAPDNGLCWTCAFMQSDLEELDEKLVDKAKRTSAS